MRTAQQDDLTFPCTGRCTMVRVEITLLCVDDSPNVGLAHRAVREALARLRLVVPVKERVVTMAAEAAATGFHGSPTILIDGKDPFDTSGDGGGLSCRLYPTPNGLEGAPSV